MTCGGRYKRFFGFLRIRNRAIVRSPSGRADPKIWTFNVASGMPHVYSFRRVLSVPRYFARWSICQKRRGDAVMLIDYHRGDPI